MRLNAFTLIEMMIALALSVTIMLMAFSAFRLCSSSIQTMNRMVVENDLLRRGTVLALDAIDTWSDYAEPAHPWGKVFNQFGNVDINGNPIAGTDNDNPNNKRPFRLVSFAASGNFNPNWVQVHDSRSWYRNHLSQSPRPFTADKGNGTMYWPNALYGGGSYSGNWNVPSSDIPPGWEARHVWGDYSLVSNTAMNPSSDVRGARPRLMLDLYIQLGALGVVNYMPAGTQSLILQPSTNLAARNATPTDSSLVFNIGEVPYSTSNPTTFGFGKLPASDPAPDPASINNEATFRLVDFKPAIPGTYPVGVSAASPGINTANFHRSDYYEGVAGRAHSNTRTWGLDFDQIFRVMMWGNTYVSDGTTWSQLYINQATRTPWRDISTRTNNTDVVGIQDGWFRDFGNVLYLVPQSYANNPEPNLRLRPANMPALSMSTLRFRMNSGEFHNTVLRLVNPETGSVLVMGIYATGTTYRGARQHWALTTDNPVTAAFDPTMGDKY
jgi:prepilin-type N-terminal cleavage/methylation domain-containing protein